MTLHTLLPDAAAPVGRPEAPPYIHLPLDAVGGVGRAILCLLGGIDVHASLIEAGDREFPPAQVPPDCLHLVLTHSHALDMAISEAILKRGDFGFFGLIGSATKKARFLRRLAERGIDPATLARLTCPIGVPGIEGKEPEVIALAVVAPLLQQPPAAAGQPALEGGGSPGVSSGTVAAGVSPSSIHDPSSV